ncbi:hypothetical protein C2G38_2078915 [Gigaspora rosea]|uniref:Uncharacterized protein n=1 Tax=Gigaspora rosea TaxID=44941 RepID=A0A397VHB7_9GLOM|nr:hypothetical protein C2G38_2078915 [Gigaspora rosea]
MRSTICRLKDLPNANPNFTCSKALSLPVHYFISYQSIVFYIFHTYLADVHFLREWSNEIKFFFAIIKMYSIYYLIKS